MAIVVLVRNLRPIDLTASLLLAYEKSRNNLEATIEWIVEEVAEDNIYEELLRVASFFSEKFEIVVKHQRDVEELYPNTDRIISSLYEILKNARLVKGRLRIQHGAILVCEDADILIKCRYFGLNSTGSLVLYENNKNCKEIVIEEHKGIKLLIEGSMNLYFLNRYGELAHLPWYCLDSSIESMMVNEVIMPPEGCSSSVFGMKSKRMLPCGYSIFDYKEYDPVGDFINSCFNMYGSCISSRKKNGSYCTQSILLNLGRKVRHMTVEKGFKSMLCDVRKNVKSPDEIIIRILKIWVLSKIMVSYDRGYVNQTQCFNLVDREGIIYKDRKEIINELLHDLKSCCYEVNDELLVEINQIECSNRPSGELAKHAFRLAEYYFDMLYSIYYNYNKATLMKFVEQGSNLSNILHMFDNLIKRRGNILYVEVKGSIFEYED